jgi:hypothetical protein
MRYALTHGRPIRMRLAVFGAVAMFMLSVAPASAAGGGVKTSQKAMLTPLVDGVTAEALITVGESLGGGYTFEAIPDGISISLRGQGNVEVYVNHETSRVPFPYAAVGTPPTTANSQNDFDNAQLSRLILHQKSAGVLSGKLVITSDQNYQRFCSNFLATATQGFDREILFTNEETPDWVNRTGNAWPTTVGAATAREGGVVVAIDVKTGKNRPILGMGRFNHENEVALPGFSQIVMLSGDDTFTSTPSQSQLFSYTASNADAVWNDEGTLRAFVSDDATRQRYEDFTLNDATSVAGHFITVPPEIARGRNADGTEMTSATVPASLGGPYDPPPATGWQPDPVTGVPVDGPQWVLERWSQLHGVFRFIRVEDLAYDKRAGMSNVAYVVDTGRGTSGDAANGKSTNGRVWKLVLDKNDPTKVTSFSILIDGDDNPVKTLNEMHQPDNIESTTNALYFTEDPGSGNQFPVDSPAPATPARVWRYDLGTRTNTAILKVDQSLDEGSTDVDPATTKGNWGAWESSGIVDASAAFGPGAFLINVQAHTLFVEVADGADNFAPAGADFLDKREGGQMLLVRVPNG